MLTLTLKSALRIRDLNYKCTDSILYTTLMEWHGMSVAPMKMAIVVVASKAT